MLKVEPCDDVHLEQFAPLIAHSPYLIMAHDQPSPGCQLFLAAAKRFGIKLGDTKRGTIRSRRGDG